MKLIKTTYLTRQEAMMLEKHYGFTVRFITMTIRGFLFEVWARSTTTERRAK